MRSRHAKGQGEPARTKYGLVRQQAAEIGAPMFVFKM